MMRPQSEITAADDAPAEKKQNLEILDTFESNSAAAHFFSANICKK